ncbi:Acetyl esterase/lipase [Marinobacter daqiaonensis]|uniref:Acetyl esterase/lipase n=1 Tax=Marinobacter daqiaonensis TaxID=650891 RepID=A0A1I6INV7_9GAMM|nr:alpha/beta hydrolase [Marinobacter daqiaonensis]SFR68413.1 Acetyl esterase/lipase [Marinobacter daqiaonensis]
MTDVHPNLRAWLDQLNALVAEQKARGVEATPAMVRDSLAGLTATFVTRAPNIADVRDIRVATGDGDVPARVYDPSPGESKPVMLFFHGGGHMAGSVAVYDPIACKLAATSGHLVVSVDYRLAPEAPYPAGLNDCLNVTRQIWALLSHHDYGFERRLTLTGDSGGATYAATVSHMLAREPGLNLKSQILIYPSLDYTMDHPSITEHGEGYLLEKNRIGWYFDHYFQGEEDRRKASPIHMEVPDGMPATLVITAGYCPLHDEGVAYALRLQAAGVSCELRDYPDMIHAFLNLEDLVPEACADTYRAIGDFVNRGQSVS